MKDNMKICFLVHDLNPKAGWGRYGLEIIERIKRQNIEVKVLSELASHIDYEVVALQHSMDNLIFVFLSAWRIRNFLKDCDIIHAFDGYPYGVIGALANIGLNKKLVINGVGTYSVAPLEQGIKGWLLKWAYKKADKIFCISRFTYGEIKKRMPELNNLEVVYLGVDLKKFQAPDGGSVFNNTPLVLSVGALKHRKGYHISIPAVALVVKKYPDLKYYIVGDQSSVGYFNELQELVKKNNLENNVIFLSNLSDEDLLALYNKINLFLLTPINKNNNFEGFGLVYLEANACGKPAVGTYDCGAEDAIDDGVNGFLVPQENVEKTAEAIVKILVDSELARQMGEAGRQKAQRMTWERTISKYIDGYRQILDV